jgi:CheY-like chemotaxis protein/HPt (histidine-containing phosphotransfer) domain-containing protein
VTIVCQKYDGECDSIFNRDIIAPKPLVTPSLVGNILLVEDTEVNQQLITFNLEQTGAQVDLAVNGLEGLQKALEVQYDLVLMDIQMPVMDGKEAMKSLLQLGVSTPVYALTANVMPSDIKEYAAIGFTGALSKPLELENLYSVLSQHLSVCVDQNNNGPQVARLLNQEPKLKLLFYKELAKQHTQITKNIHNLDYAGLIKATHIIKGSAVSFGYDELTNLAAKSLLLLRQKQYVQGIQHCTKLNQKMAGVLNEHHD